MRRLGWFAAGAATALGAVAAGEVARRRMRGELGDELPPAVGYEEVMGDESDEDVVPAADVPLAAPPPSAADSRADELRAKIAESRERLHAKAKAGAEDADDDTSESEPG